MSEQTKWKYCVVGNIVRERVDENGNNYSIGDSALKMLEDLHVLDGLGKTNQMSLFDFNW